MLLVAKLALAPLGNGLWYSTFIKSLMVGADWRHNLTHPWAFITHMFLHEGIWHLLWNMLGLYFFGRIVGDLLGDRRVLPIYLLSGLAGGVAYFALANILPGFEPFALGASAAFMGLLAVAGVTAPNYLINLLLLGEVKLKYIVAFFLILDLVSISLNFGAGGSYGHLGGAAMGFLIAQQLQNGNDWTSPVNRIWDSITGFFENMFSEKQRPKSTYRNPDMKKQTVGGGRPTRTASRRSATADDELSYQEQLDAILDKIKLTGYDSLTAAEKEFLFNASNR
jgi:membrane associated rhomboid family serine protease